MAGLAPSGRDARRVTLRVGVLNGPNLHRLGTRAPDQYGTDTLAQIEEGLRVRADRLGVEIEFYQSDDEDALVERITDRAEAVDGWVVNAAGFTHTSIPIRDALAAADS